MKLTDLIKTLIELNEHDPDVEIVTIYREEKQRSEIVNVALFDGMVTIYGEEE